MNKFDFLKLLYLLYILTVGSFLLPWFSFDPGVMGYRFGFIFLQWFAVPMIILGFCTFGRLKGKISLVLGELSIFAYLTLLVVTVGKWMEACNLKNGWDFRHGIKGALPTYWITVAVFIIYAVVFQCTFLKKNNK